MAGASARLAVDPLFGNVNAACEITLAQIFFMPGYCRMRIFDVQESGLLTRTFRLRNSRF
jgi:hypothetical protein